MYVPLTMYAYFIDANGDKKEYWTNWVIAEDGMYYLTIGD